MSAADAEKKFKNVRTGYGRYLKKVKAIPSGSGRDAVPTPKDFAGLDWLKKYISHRPTVSNMNPVEVNSDEDNNSVGEQGETNDQTDQAGSETLELEDSGGSVETSKETGVDEKRTESAEVVEKKRRKVSVTNRPWSAANRKKEAKQRDDVEAALLVTANSLVEQAKKLPESPKVEPECEYSYFCKSLLPRLKKLPPRTRAAVRMSIEQVLFEAEFPSTQSHPMQMRAASAHVPMHHGYYYQNHGNYQQSQGNGQEPQQQLDFNVNREQQMHSTDFLSL